MCPAVEENPRTGQFLRPHPLDMAGSFTWMERLDGTGAPRPTPMTTKWRPMVYPEVSSLPNFFPRTIFFPSVNYVPVMQRHPFSPMRTYYIQSMPTRTPMVAVAP